MHQLTSKYSRNLDTGKAVFNLDLEAERLASPVNCSVDAYNCFSAGVYKSTDTG